MPPKKATKCSKCGNPRLGHKGPLGRNCTQARKASSHKDNDTDSWADVTPGKGKRKASRTGNNTELVMAEMIRQMGTLAVAVQKISDRQDMLVSEFNTTKASMLLLQGLGTNGQNDILSGFNTTKTLPAAGGNNDEILSLASGARVTRKVVNAAKTGEFIHLSDFIPCLEPSTSLDASIAESKLVFKPHRTRRNLDNFQTWSKAWAGYESLLIGHDITLYDRLSDYRGYIQDLDQKYKWAAVQAYDARNRHKKSLSKSFNFHETDLEAFSYLLDHQKPNSGCYRCGSLSHYCSDCPFRERDEMEAPKTQTPNRQRDSFSQKRSQFRQNWNNQPGYHQGWSGPGWQPQQPYTWPQQSSQYQHSWNTNAQPFYPMPQQQHYPSQSTPYQSVCLNYNAGICKLGAGCPRRHACSKCFGKEPLPRCPNCNATPTSMQFNSK